jgi:hypothetical protein
VKCTYTLVRNGTFGGNRRLEAALVGGGFDVVQGAHDEYFKSVVDGRMKFVKIVKIRETGEVYITGPPASLFLIAARVSFASS